MTRTLIVTVLAALTLTGSAQASSWTWTAAAAEDSFIDEYQTVDPWALQEAQVKETLGVSNTRAIAVAKRAARPEWAHCTGAGKHQKAYYGRFWCRTHLTSWLTDWEATRKVTVYVTGRYTFVVKSGWH